MVQQAATVSLMVLFLVPQLRNAYGTAAIGIICGLYWAVSSNMTVEATQRLTGGGGFAIGHQQQFAIWFVDKVAGRFGKKEESLDNLKLPKFLSNLPRYSCCICYLDARILSEPFFNLGSRHYV